MLLLIMENYQKLPKTVTPTLTLVLGSFGQFPISFRFGFSVVFFGKISRERSHEMCPTR